ncbi:hypothetical protein FGO68_gene10684 [Halteria grandinella]|uniref:Uncharacterized protein n=1 Tax=Halteria grandinella TaxID=5974 RepID=A0A8J8P1W2_HALGN|nr:hypothetical protein FGO68_gene10684 [Halteria grandinella]
MRRGLRQSLTCGCCSSLQIHYYPLWSQSPLPDNPQISGKSLSQSFTHFQQYLNRNFLHLSYRGFYHSVPPKELDNCLPGNYVNNMRTVYHGLQSNSFACHIHRTGNVSTGETSFSILEEPGQIN